MEFLLLWNILRRWWVVILIPFAITIIWSLPALPSTISPPETYGATLRFTAAAPPDAVNAIAAEQDDGRSGSYEDTAYVPWLASEYVVINLPAWVTSSSFATEVSAELAAQGIEISAEDLRPAFTADSARSILTVYLGWDDEQELEAIGAATIQVLQEKNQDYFPQFDLAPARIVPLDEVDVVRTAPPLTARLRPLIQIFIGLGVGLGLAFLADYMDDRLRSTDDLDTLGLTTIGNIPYERNS